jgi:hypothetical protein
MTLLPYMTRSVCPQLTKGKGKGTRTTKKSADENPYSLDDTRQIRPRLIAINSVMVTTFQV